MVGQLIEQGLIDEGALTVNGRTIGDNCRGTPIEDERVIRPFDTPLRERAGFIVLSGNLFDSAIMKTSVISPEFRERYLSDPDDPEAFEGQAVVFDGPEDYHARIDDKTLEITPETILFIRGAGPIGYPGSAEVVNMRPPAYLLAEGVHSLPCVGDGRQSGTSGSPSILNASPEAAAEGGLAILRTGDRIRIDLKSSPPTCWSPRKSWPSGAGSWWRTAASNIPKARPRGRKSSARWSATCRPVRSWKARRNTSGSRKPAAFRATVTDRFAATCRSSLPPVSWRPDRCARRR